jgi:hypothetical protein
VVVRTATRKREYEQMVGYLHGIDAQGNVAHLMVHKKGDRIRFTGEAVNHEVERSSSVELEDWVREAETECGLVEVMGVLRGYMNTPENLAKFELLNASAANKKKEIEASSQL